MKEGGAGSYKWQESKPVEAVEELRPIDFKRLHPGNMKHGVRKVRISIGDFLPYLHIDDLSINKFGKWTRKSQNALTQQIELAMRDDMKKLRNAERDLDWYSYLNISDRNQPIFEDGFDFFSSNPDSIST